MKRSDFFAFLALASFSGTASLASAAPVRFEVDDEHFSMVFDIMHTGYAPALVGDEINLRFGFEAIKDSGWF
ncbi:hypothetical protein [Marinobacter sp.]|uniref:hypothetical protein n=1 Tax=Marinobacter sp. TaxID=50741 RepID=UPI003A90E1C5